jgi:hypothetical protein
MNPKFQIGADGALLSPLPELERRATNPGPTRPEPGMCAALLRSQRPDPAGRLPLPSASVPCERAVTGSQNRHAPSPQPTPRHAVLPQIRPCTQTPGGHKPRRGATSSVALSSVRAPRSAPPLVLRRLRRRR